MMIVVRNSLGRDDVRALVNKARLHLASIAPIYNGKLDFSECLTKGNPADKHELEQCYMILEEILGGLGQ